MNRSNRSASEEHRAGAVKPPTLPDGLPRTIDLIRARRRIRERVSEDEMPRWALKRLARDRRRDVVLLLRRRHGGVLSTPRAVRLLRRLGLEPTLSELVGARRALLRSEP